EKCSEEQSLQVDNAACRGLDSTHDCIEDAVGLEEGSGRVSGPAGTGSGGVSAVVGMVGQCPLTASVGGGAGGFEGVLAVRGSEGGLYEGELAVGAMGRGDPMVSELVGGLCRGG